MRRTPDVHSLLLLLNEIQSIITLNEVDMARTAMIRQGRNGPKI